MKNKELIKQQIKILFPNMEDKEVDRLAEEYIINETLKKAKTMTPEAMKRDLGEGE